MPVEDCGGSFNFNRSDPSVGLRQIASYFTAFHPEPTHARSVLLGDNMNMAGDCTLDSLQGPTVTHQQLGSNQISAPEDVLDVHPDALAEEDLKITHARYSDLTFSLSISLEEHAHN